MNQKKKARIRRANKARTRIRKLGVNRLCINRSSQHIYAQILSHDGARVIAATSTLDKDLRGDLDGTSNVDAAKKVGARIAQLATEAGVESVAFDRSGFKFHGRVKALADAAREAGLQF